jgi:3-hydroxybutyryl-CoA dehydrogenase
MQIRTVFIAGSGLMGGGIAQVCAQSGYNVIINDLSMEILDKSIKTISWSMGKLIEKGKVSGKLEDLMGRIKKTTDLKDAAQADLVIEGIIENVDAKRKLFIELDGLCRPDVIFATNTSAIPITEIAKVTRRSDIFVGMHFTSPVPIQRLVEIIKGLTTSDRTVEIAEAFCKSLGKETIRVNKDVPGFVLNRINFPSNVEAIRLVEAGIVSVEDVDKAMRLGFGRPMGPFETQDFAGLDVSFNALKAVYEETRDQKFYPPMLLKRKVSMGQLGRKTGIGWYKYDKEGNRIGMA